MKHLAHLSFLVLLVGCADPYGAQQASLTDLLQQYGQRLPADSAVVLVVPLQMCGSCVDQSLTFAAEYRAAPRLRTVVTQTQSPKDTRLRLPEGLLGVPHVFVDTANMLAGVAPFDAYSTLAYFDGGRIERLVGLVPQNVEAQLAEARRYLGTTNR